MGGAIGLLVSTVLLRPYVFLFLALYLWAAAAAIGWRRTALFTATAQAMAVNRAVRRHPMAAVAAHR